MATGKGALPLVGNSPVGRRPMSGDRLQALPEDVNVRKYTSCAELSTNGTCLGALNNTVSYRGKELFVSPEIGVRCGTRHGKQAREGFRDQHRSTLLEPLQTIDRRA